MQLDVIENGEAFEALAREWDELVADSAVDTVFSTWEWLYTWWRHLSGTRRLAIVTVRSDRRLIAIAPFMLGRTRAAALLPMRVRQFLGCGDVGSDYLDVIVRRGHEETAHSVLVDYVLGQRLWIEAHRLRPGASFESIAGRAQQQGWRRMPVQPDVCPYISLREHTWESFLGTLGPSHRANLRRRLRKLSQAFSVRFEIVTAEDERARALETLVRLHNGRWRHRGGSTAFHSAELLRFHDEVTRRLLARGWLRLFVLRLDGEPAAVLYGISFRGRFHFYQAGFDEDRFGKYSVGLVLMGLSIKAALEERASEYDLLHGDESYKSLWAQASRELVSLELYPPRLRGWLCLTHVGAGRAARRLVRSVVDVLSGPGGIDGARSRAVVSSSR